jgi:flavodoxin
MANRKIVILYGSETGTAKEVAERIWREAKRSVLYIYVIKFETLETDFLCNFITLGIELRD